MGKRRIRILQQLFPSFNIIGFDTNNARCVETGKLYKIAVFNSFSDILSQNPDAIFICTSPQYHADIFSEIDLDHYHTLSEIDLSSKGYDRLIAAEKGSARRHFLSSTNLFDLGYKYIIKLLNSTSPAYYRYHVGQYLKDWHPWDNYEGSFFSHKETNGCREILAIELPWIIRAFGQITDFSILKNKISNLNIDYNDGYFINFCHESGSMGQVAVDVISRVPEREIEIYNEEQYIKWDGHPNPIFSLEKHDKRLVPIDLYQTIDHEKEYAKFIAENPYIEEIRLFINSINDNSIEYPITYAENLEIISLIDELEKEL